MEVTLDWNLIPAEICIIAARKNCIVLKSTLATLVVRDQAKFIFCQKLKFSIGIRNWTEFVFIGRLRWTLKRRVISRSAHRTPNFTNSKHFVSLLFEYFFQIKVLNQYQNTPKNANITRYIKNKKSLCNTLNWGNWNLGFVKLVDRWAERDIYYVLVF